MEDDTRAAVSSAWKAANQRAESGALAFERARETWVLGFLSGRTLSLRSGVCWSAVRKCQQTDTRVGKRSENQIGGLAKERSEGLPDRAWKGQEPCINTTALHLLGSAQRGTRPFKPLDEDTRIAKGIAGRTS